MPEGDAARVRGGKRARTRALLIEAAAGVIAEKGFEGTSLDAVAARAGVTRGAIYGNFRDKEALFLAVVASRWAPVAPPGASAAGVDGGSGDFAARMAALCEVLVAEMPARRRTAVHAASFQLYALRHEVMRALVVQANTGIYREMAAAIPPASVPVPPDMFVRVMHALVDGLMFLHALTPELVDAAVVRAAFALVAQARPGETVGPCGSGTE